MPCAAANNLRFLDLPNLYGALDQQHNAHLGWDTLHPNAEGHRLAAEAVQYDDHWRLASHMDRQNVAFDPSVEDPSHTLRARAAKQHRDASRVRKTAGASPEDTANRGFLSGIKHQGLSLPACDGVGQSRQWALPGRMRSCWDWKNGPHRLCMAVAMGAGHR